MILFHIQAAFVKMQYKSFRLCSLYDKQFKCLIIVCGLQLSSDSDILIRILRRIESYLNLTLKDIRNECHYIIILKNDTKMIERPNPNSFDLMKMSHSDSSINVTKHDLRNFPCQNRMYNVHYSNSRRSTRPPINCRNYGHGISPVSAHLININVQNVEQLVIRGDFENATSPHPIIECQKGSIVYMYF